MPRPGRGREQQQLLTDAHDDRAGGELGAAVRGAGEVPLDDQTRMYADRIARAED